MDGFSCLSDDMIPIIANHLVARDRFQFALVNKSVFNLIWPKENSFEIITEKAGFHTSVHLQLTDLPTTLQISKNGRVIAGTCRESNSLELLIWRIQTRSMQRIRLEACTATDLTLSVSDDGSCIALLDPVNAKLHAFHVSQQSQQQCGSFEETHSDQHQVLHLPGLFEAMSCVSLSSCGTRAALFNAASHTVHLVHISQTSIALVESFEVSISSEAELVQMRLCGLDEVTLVFRERSGANHTIVVYVVDSEMGDDLGNELWREHVDTSARVRGVGLDARVVAICCNPELSKKRSSRRSLCSELHSVARQPTAAGVRLEKVLSVTDTIKMRRFERVQRSACAVFQEKKYIGQDALGKSKYCNAFGLVGVTTVRNRWVLRVVLAPNENPSSLLHSKLSITHSVPLVYSENALLEEHAMIRFSRTARWVLIVRRDGVRPSTIQPSSGTPQSVVFGLQNIIMV